MKVFLILLSFAVCIVLANADDPETCNSCFGSNVTTCASTQMVSNCSIKAHPNIGSGDCYTAAGWYSVNGTWTMGALRGCINCTDEESAKQMLKTEFEKATGWTLLVNYLEIRCCNSGNNCNNQSVAAPATPTTGIASMSTPSGSSGDTATKTPTSHAIRLWPISGILVFATIFIGAFLI